MNRKKGYFITFEGIEGSGKSTQISKLFDRLNWHGCRVIKTREPGGTDFGQTIRQWILDPKTQFKSIYTELLLFYADRLEHVEECIRPALDSGDIVLCDRYIDSTYAYQIGGRKMPEALIHQLNHTVNLMPDATILFDIAPEEGLKRAKTRAALDRFEQENIDFHTGVRNAYLSLAAQYPNRIKVIKVASHSVDNIHDTIWNYITHQLRLVKE